MKPLTQKYNLDSFNSGHFFEDLADHDSFYFKKFFGGLSIYVFGKMVAFVCEKPERKTFRDQKFKTEVWNGCLIPSTRDNHAALLKLLKGAVIHPVIGKWLYLPQKSEFFEDSMIQLIEMIQRKNTLVGIEPELKIKKSKSKSKSKKTKLYEKKTDQN